MLAAMHRLLDADDWLDRLRGRLAGVGGPARVERDGDAMTGVLLGVDRHGALRLRTRSGSGPVRRVVSGALTLGAAFEGPPDRKLTTDVGAGGRSCYLGVNYPKSHNSSKG